MTRSTFALISAFTASILLGTIDEAQAMGPAPLSSHARLSVTLSSVFCGANGCVPVTRVKRCAPDTLNHGLPSQRAIIVHHTCNFL